ncbi:hypothetical protein [Amycolatopsis sp. CA-230715]|uniref:hypothetical protein n=1 Tax=Amycolatopsis sp. CA-230715 TaxID=2745196 RepID=UPI001C02146C|nr:hypothetical protein [Amycolatopsis sp. CA-230715]QWF81087.1 hypothetical protein HUW46_04513 [Amycolatopsis sp. CA-230715]
MDLADLAGEALTLLAGFAGAVGKGALDKAQNDAIQALYTAVRQRLGGRRGDAAALKNLEQAPADPGRREVVTGILHDALEADPGFAAELREAVRQARVTINHDGDVRAGPVAGDQAVGTIGSGSSSNTLIQNNSGSIDQSHHATTDNRRSKTTNRFGIGTTPLVLIAALMIAVVTGVTTSVIVSVNNPAWFDRLFPPQDDVPDLPANVADGKPYQYLPTQPYEAVRHVYELVDKNDPAACERFEENVRPVFARHFGAPDCAAAVTMLHARVTDDWAFAFSVRQRDSTVHFPPTMKISSCSFPIKGGPSLGLFTLTRLDKGQWLITNHETEASPCPPVR